MTGLQFWESSENSESEGFSEGFESIDFEGNEFGFFHFSECKKLIDMVKNRQVRLSDVGVLFALMSLVNMRSGRIKFLVKNMAEELNYTPHAVSLALSRLKKVCLVASFTERNGDKYYMINPYLFSVGSRQRWGLSIKKFFSAFNE
jgi:hypothetical protein